MDDLIFRSCSVRVEHAGVEHVEHAGTDFASLDAQEALQVLEERATEPSRYFTFEEPVCLSADGKPLPPPQPGAGIYTSPLTINVNKNIDTNQKVIRDALQALQMVYREEAGKFKVNSFFCFF